MKSKIAKSIGCKLEQILPDVVTAFSNGSITLEYFVAFIFATVFLLLLTLLILLPFGFCISVLWNVVIPPMFGIGKLSIANAAILLYVIVFLVGNFNIVSIEDE